MACWRLEERQLSSEFDEQGERFHKISVPLEVWIYKGEKLNELIAVDVVDQKSKQKITIGLNLIINITMMVKIKKSVI